MNPEGKSCCSYHAISTALNSVFAHLENKNSFITKLFVDFSPVFNSISAMKLMGKLNTLSLSITLCNWIMDFLTNRPQTVWIGSHTSSMCSTPETPKAALSPRLFTPCNHDCTPRHPENSTRKYADNTTIISLGSIPGWGRTFLCGVCMFSPCLRGFPPAIKTCMSGTSGKFAPMWR